MPERATLDEVLEFANKVREAGGGNPLDALMPAVPEDASQCLIAKNLNFNCKVHNGPEKNGDIFEGAYPEGVKDGEAWFMLIDTKALRDRIADALGLPKISWTELAWMANEPNVFYAVELPERIGAVAAEFDKWSDPIWQEENSDNPKADEYGDVFVIAAEASPEDIERLKEFWPYIDAATKEAYANATFINERGEIVV